jgi:hypothetical protein
MSGKVQYLSLFAQPFGHYVFDVFDMSSAPEVDVRYGEHYESDLEHLELVSGRPLLVKKFLLLRVALREAYQRTCC